LKKINLGFVITFSKNSWLGGNIYILNLIKQIKENSKNINPVILTNFSLPKNNFSEFKNIKILKSKAFSHSIVRRIISKIQISIFGKDFFLEKFLKKNKINTLSHFYISGRNSAIKSLFWIPDFQELYNLKYISIKRKILRKINILYAIKNSTKIILSSNTVKKDLKKIDYYGYKNSVVFRPFFVTPNNIKNKKILKKYNVKKKFFLLPNQYWKHKNHLLILNILKDLKTNKKNNIEVVSTGYFNDYRYPEYKEEILSFIKKNNLKSCYKILGVIPFQDLMDLMQYSIAVINPSKSEGWSSTVEQAKSMGKMVLLSNLKVHREQSPHRKHFFETNDKDKLRNIMLNLHNSFDSKSEKKKMIIAKKKMLTVKKNFIIDYVKLINQINQ
jgi:hypothetical protein